MTYIPPDRNAIQVLPFDDSRVTCLHDDVRSILDQLTSLDIALRNRDYVSQSIPESTAHANLAQAMDLIRSLSGL